MKFFVNIIGWTYDLAKTTDNYVDKDVISNVHLNGIKYKINHCNVTSSQTVVDSSAPLFLSQLVLGKENSGWQNKKKL